MSEQVASEHREALISLLLQLGMMISFMHFVEQSG